ncbi:MAG: hypothetical protein LBQ91_04405, partial [Oscillospiraceae bacterium]|nr:hypothetical protein [Oscillospiraceae bacterium]
MISKKARIASDCVYGVFVAAVVCFVLIALFGSDEIVNPDAAYTVSRRVQAVVILAAGTLPMTIAAMAVYHDNSVKTSGSPGRNAF